MPVLRRPVEPAVDSVAKVENRTTRNSREDRFLDILPPQGAEWRYEGPWSFLCETMWSLISSHAKRISGPSNFGHHTEKRRQSVKAADAMGGSVQRPLWRYHERGSHGGLRDCSASSTSSRTISRRRLDTLHGADRFLPPRAASPPIAPVVVLSGTQVLKREIDTSRPVQTSRFADGIALEGFGCRDGRAQNAVGRVGPADRERFGVRRCPVPLRQSGPRRTPDAPPPPPRRRSSVPTRTPSAPAASAVAIARPVPMPPAASTGTSTAEITSPSSVIAGLVPRTCPPASAPCAMTKSHPAPGGRDCLLPRSNLPAGQRAARVRHLHEPPLRLAVEELDDLRRPRSNLDALQVKGRAG